MKEYTILSFASVFLAILIDGKSGVCLLRKKIYYFFLFFILCFKFMVNGYLTGSGIVIYNPEFFLGLRIGPIPVEDFFFGFSMVTLSIVFWEYFKNKFSS
jgi:lycopene cyclase domain-containing protein